MLLTKTWSMSGLSRPVRLIRQILWTSDSSTSSITNCEQSVPTNAYNSRKPAGVLYWWRASIPDSQATQDFRRHRPYLFCRDLKTTVNSVIFSMSDMTDEIKLWNPTFSWVLGFPYLGFSTYGGLNLLSIRFPSVLLLCSKTFSSKLCTEYQKTAVFALAPPMLEASGIFHNGRVCLLPTHLWVCYRDRGGPLYTAGVRVRFSDFRLPGWALAPSFMTISPLCLVTFEK